jgi:hypothetical protein
MCKACRGERRIKVRVKGRGVYILMKKTEFSKLLTVLITVFFFGVILFSLAIWYLEGRVPSEILSTVAIPFGSVTGFYFFKAAYENGKKIDGSRDENERITERKDDEYEQF